MGRTYKQFHNSFPCTEKRLGIMKRAVQSIGDQAVPLPYGLLPFGFLAVPLPYGLLPLWISRQSPYLTCCCLLDFPNPLLFPISPILLLHPHFRQTDGRKDGKTEGRTDGRWNIVLEIIRCLFLQRRSKQKTQFTFLRPFNT